MEKYILKSLLVLSICCIFVSDIATETRCIEKERKSLFQFKSGLVDDYGLILSWGRSSQDCCLWRGVGCSNTTNHVIMLDLHGYYSRDLDAPVGFRGAIDSSLLELRHIKHLDLSFNTFPRIPDFLGSLNNLRYLNLSNIKLEAPELPPQIGNLSNLRTLDLSTSYIILKNPEWLYKLFFLEYLSLEHLDISMSNNKLLGNLITRLPSLFELQLSNCFFPTNLVLPVTNFSKSLSILDISHNDLPSSWIYPWLFNFSSSLTSIDLSYNNLIGTLPDGFGSFKSIQNLVLTGNGLKGGIPRSFGNLSNIRSLYLDGNNLKQDLPSLFHILAPAKKAIQVLDLGYNNISGSMPDFTTFTALRELNLRYNELKGSFPDKFEQISNLYILDFGDNQINGFLPELSALSSLRELYFERNRVEGSLGERIMPLSKLQFLGVSSNLLHGTISSHLVYLDLSHNSLVLEIDSGWSPPFSLDVISLSSCKLGPSFPAWLRTQNNFSIFDISDAQINDSVPDWFWKQLTPNLRYLNISSNSIHGIVPGFMYGDVVKYFDLSSNNFYGPVPLFPSYTHTLVLNNNMFSGSISFLSNLIYIHHLDLSNNQLSGELPGFWMNLTGIFFLNLENNKFSGRIPTSMGNLSNIVMLSVRTNNLSGVLPSSLRNCIYLQFLDLGENNLSGPIPPWIGENLTELIILSLPSNGFHGNIPTSICRLSKIQILDISVNNISGIIPKCIGNLKGMTERKIIVAFIGFYDNGLQDTRLSLSITNFVFKALLQWKGTESEYKNTLGLVISLDLASNALNGEIPGEITNLRGLVSLNLSRNFLTWKIPQTIGKLRRLDVLDLSRNHLVDGIPTSLSQLTNLGLLDLSNNNLSGRIPISTQLQSFNASFYSGNPALCGLPLPNKCPGDFEPDTPQTRVETDDTGDQYKLITRGFFISLLIGLVFGFWAVFGTLFVKNSWRYAYFMFLTRVKDWIYVTITVHYARLQRRD